MILGSYFTAQIRRELCQMTPRFNHLDSVALKVKSKSYVNTHQLILKFRGPRWR